MIQNKIMQVCHGASRWRLAMLVALVLGGTIAFVVFGAPGIDRVEALIRSFGAAAPAVFVASAAGLTVLVFPKPVLAVAAGLVFGTALGTTLAVIGASAGAAGAYMIGRWLGRSTFAELERGRLALSDQWLGRRGFVAVLYARLVPVVPFAMVNYASGISSIRFRDFFPATVLGIVPSTFAFAALGGSFQDPTSPAVLSALAMTLALAVAPPLLHRFGIRTGVTARREAGS